MTFNRDKGFGTANRGRYSNTKVDALTEDALQTVDDIKREAYLQRATEIAINVTGIVPLHFQVNLWAARDGIAYQPRILVGQIAESIVKHAKDRRCDLIYIGTRGMSELGKALVGSTATKVLHISEIPVLLVK